MTIDVSHIDSPRVPVLRFLQVSGSESVGICFAAFDFFIQLSVSVSLSYQKSVSAVYSILVAIWLIFDFRKKLVNEKPEEDGAGRKRKKNANKAVEE